MSRVLQDRGPDERLISFPTMLGLRFYQNSPYNVGHIGRLLEKIPNFPLFPTRLQTTDTSRLISSPQFFSLQCPLSSLIVKYESSLQVFRFMALFQEAPILVCEILYMIELTANASVVELVFSVET